MATVRSQSSDVIHARPVSFSRPPLLRASPAPAWMCAESGVLPTPGVAYLTAARAADIGVMLSASHNPMPDNGIKFFARGGHKLGDAIEDAVESRLGEPWDRPTGADVGRVTDDVQGADDYVAHLLYDSRRTASGRHSHRGRLRQRRGVICRGHSVRQGRAPMSSRSTTPQTG